jgi:sugar O-acyltransferase (sialic acid O-acetyltransferase NeuD family)
LFQKESLGMNTPVILIGYSGHAFVVYGVFQSQGRAVVGYCDAVEKAVNPFNLPYLGRESDPFAQEKFRNHPFFIAIGDNRIRQKIFLSMLNQGFYPTSALHANSTISPYTTLGNGILVSAGAIINPIAKIGEGTICNTACVIEHECIVGDFAHIGPGTVLCGNVSVGERSFIGANSVVKQGISIGQDVMIGAGSVIIRDVPDGATVVGNPGRIIRHK